MAHLEVINIRCFDQDINKILSRYVKPLLSQSEVLKDWDIKVFRHYRLGMELSILLISKIRNFKVQKSDFGIQLADNLKPYGIVNHSAWEELTT
ncbi:MAG: hypothetical protein MJE63_31345 [Proteobacteria bacterium]|nr:hypothetical protein [Pseudomonadota bacterium]